MNPEINSVREKSPIWPAGITMFSRRHVQVASLLLLERYEKILITLAFGFEIG
jgi:hypothetical protein